MLYFGYDVPTCGSRVPSVYVGVCLPSVLAYAVDIYFLYGVEDGVAYTDTYMYCWRLGLAGSSALAYLYVLVDCFMLQRQVLMRGRGGWLSVKQMDPVSFSAEIGNLLYIKSETFRKLIKQKPSFI